MWPNKRIITIGVFVISLCIANAQGTNTTAGSSQTGYEFEGKLVFSQDLPVGLVAGNAEHPELVEVKSIRFENTYGNAWGVTACVGWLPVTDTTWKIKTELLDENGRVLRHSRDDEVILTCKVSVSDQTTMHYVDLDVDAMLDQGRRHARRFRVHLEPFERPFDTIESTDSKQHAIEVAIIEKENGKPITGACAVVESMYITDNYQRYKTLYATESRGRCEVSLAANNLCSLGIEVQKQGFATMAKTWSNYASAVGRNPLVNLPEKHTFEMLPATAVGGIVQDEEGNPIEAAEVSFSAYLNEPGERISIRRSVLTDAKGQWRVEGIPAEIDRISIGLKHPEYGGDYGTRRNLTGQALLDAKALKHIEILNKGITMTGKVLSDEGQPVNMASVLLSQRSSMSFFSITDSSGSFRFACSGDRNSYGEVPAVIVEAPGYAPALKFIDIEPNPEPLEFHLSRGKTLKCRVVDSEGKPVAGAWTVVEPLLAENKNYSVWLEDTDQKGEFEIPNVPDSDIGITIGKLGYIAVRDFVLVPSENEFTIPMKRASTVKGTVTDAGTGKTIPNFEIALVSSYGGRERIGNPMDFAEGAYELSFDEASPQPYRFRCYAVGYESATSEEFRVDEGRRVIDFKLARASDFDEKTAGQPRKEDTPPDTPKITGIVRDEKGLPVPGAVVSARPSLGEEDVVTNNKGEFTIKSRRISSVSSAVTDAVYLLVRHKERNLAAALQLYENNDKYEVKLTPGVIVSGKVVDVNDKGIPDTQISLTFWGSSTGYDNKELTEINSDGNFEIRAIPIGYRYSVEASADGYGQRYIQANTSEAAGNRMELEPLVLNLANLSTSGVVVDEINQPVSNIRIYAYGNGQPNRETYTNSKGEFTLENMSEGPINIQANSREPKRMFGRAKAEGGAKDIKIVVEERDSSGRTVSIQPPSLVGKPLSDLKEFGIELFPDAKDKIMLVCFFDMQQRPSRNCLMQLRKRAQELNSQDIAIVAIQASKIDKSTLDEWIKEQKIPFPVGFTQTAEEITLFKLGVKSLPWLILTDMKHSVTAEGFSLSELDDKIEK